VSEQSPSPSAANSGRFPKGRSGNPGGRPKASRAAQGSAFDIVLKKILTVGHGADTRKITIEEALQQRTFQDALAGKLLAMREVVKWIMKREAWRAKHAPTTPGSLTPMLASRDPDNADAALVLLGIVAPDPAGAEHRWNRSQLLIEPWVVQAALRRRRGGHRLTDEDRHAIKILTRDPDSLRWPRDTQK
jgi:Family of unknown function (DUF5681)